jgi:hypothetical protein
MNSDLLIGLGIIGGVLILGYFFVIVPWRKKSLLPPAPIVPPEPIYPGPPIDVEVPEEKFTCSVYQVKNNTSLPADIDFIECCSGENVNIILQPDEVHTISVRNPFQPGNFFIQVINGPVGGAEGVCPEK